MQQYHTAVAAVLVCKVYTRYEYAYHNLFVCLSVREE